MTPTLTQSSGRRGRGPLLLVAAAFSLGSAAVYLAVLPALLQASLAYGLLFAPLTRTPTSPPMVAEPWSDGGQDFPPTSLRPTPGRAGQAGTGGDAK